VISREFLQVAGRQIHCRIAGVGPPIVLLHDSPRSSVLHLPQLEHFADEFTVIALDTPGYGNSTPLPREPQPEIGEFADSLAETLTALGIERCPVYGFHTSSKIALEFAVRHPKHVSLAVMDGLNLPPGGPGEEFIARYMKPFEVSEDGSHLTTAWSRARDLHRFFPWFDTSAKARLPMEFPDPLQLHAYTLDLLMAGADYSSAYSAAMRYLALPRLAALTADAVFMCRKTDPLYSYLDTVEQHLPRNARVLRLSGDRVEWLDTLRKLFANANTGFPPYRRVPPSTITGQTYVSLPHGQVRVQVQGPSTGVPLVLLHDLPGSVQALQSVASTLAADRRVISLDLPGEAESDPLASPDCHHYAATILGVLADLNISRADLYAQHLAAPIAVDCALQAPALIRTLVLDGPHILGKKEQRQLWKDYCPAIMPRWDGTHLVVLWHMLRDRELNWPWFARGVDAIRRRDLPVDAATLHQLVTDLVKQPAHYRDACLAAIEYPLAEALQRLACTTIILDVSDDPRYRTTGKAARLLPGSRLIRSAGPGAAALLEALREPGSTSR